MTGSPSTDAKRMTITPDIARRMLAKNGCNRPLSEHTVATYAAAMKRGEWKFNGEAIILADDGTVLSAQHRLHACIRAAVPFDTLVVTGIDKEVFDTLDGGKKRAAADVMAIQGTRHYVLTASAARAILMLIEGQQFTTTNIQVRKCAAQHPEIVHWAHRFVGVQKLLPGAFVGLVTLMDEIHGRDLTTTFFDQCTTGVSLAANSPAQTLREKFIDRARGVQFTSALALAYMVKAANAHIQGRDVKLLRMVKDEATPRLIGLPDLGKNEPA